MKKKRVLKNWIEYLLVSINFVAMLFAPADHPDDKIFYTKTIICLIIIVINTIILIKYGKLFKEEN